MAKPKSLVPNCVQLSPMVKGAVYVGIDQSMTGTGICVFDEQTNLLGNELISTKPGTVPMDQVNRIVALFGQCYEYINKLAAGRMACVVMEDFAYSQPQQMALLGGLGWHFRIMLSRTPWHFATCSTNLLKKFATGKGTSEKEQVMMNVYKRWTFEPSDNNIADAYVLGRIALVAYAKLLPGFLGVRKDDLEIADKLTVYR